MRHRFPDPQPDSHTVRSLRLVAAATRPAVGHATRGPHVQILRISTVAMIFVGIAPIVSSSQAWADVVFDNFSEPQAGSWHAATGELFAQRFDIDGFNAIDSVTLRLRRNGLPTGVFSVELWTAGEDQWPGEPLGKLGSMNVQDIHRSDIESRNYRFDEWVPALEGSESYFVVMNFQDVIADGELNYLAWRMTESDRFFYDNGVVRIGEPKDWLIAINHESVPLFIDHLSFLMQVEADTVIAGDFNRDQALTANDIDLLTTEIGVMEPHARFDLNRDGLVNHADHGLWVQSLANTFFGDADLNGRVEFADFLVLATGFGKAGSWAQGDFDGDGETLFNDFLLLSENFGKTANLGASVPEPDVSFVLMIGLVTIILHRNSRQCRLRKSLHEK